MRDRHTGPASGCGGCLRCEPASFLLVLSFRRSAIMACGDGDHAAAASTDRAGVRVVGEDGT